MIVDQTSMPAKYPVLHNYLKYRYPGCTIKLIYEAGFSGFWLHDLLEADSIECIVTPPNKVTEEKVLKVKTDRVDARRLSRNFENGDYRSCYVPDKELREDRQVSRTLLMIQKDIIRTKNRIRRFFDFHGLNDLVRSGCCLSINARYSQTYQHFKSVPGIGWLTAIRLVLEWSEDLSRFSSGKALSSYLGLTASEYSRGQTVRRGRITRQGHSSVRAWLIQCSWIAIRKDPVLLKKFQDVRKNTGSRKKAIVAVAR